MTYLGGFSHAVPRCPKLLYHQPITSAIFPALTGRDFEFCGNLPQRGVCTVSRVRVRVSLHVIGDKAGG